MEKILIEVEGTIHTFESIKEAANYRTDFLKRMESSLGNSPNERLYIDNLIRNKFLSNPKEFYDSRMKGCPIVEIENLLMDLCAAGIDIDEYFVCKKQSKQKPGFCGNAPYKRICKEMDEEDADDFLNENDVNEDMLDEFLFSDSLYFCSSTKKGRNKKNIAKRRKKNKNKKTHRKQ